MTDVAQRPGSTAIGAVLSAPFSARARTSCGSTPATATSRSSGAAPAS